VIGALVVYLILRVFVFDGVRVASSSMEPTLRVGDRLLANTFVYGTVVPVVGLQLPGITSPARGDVVLFRHPDRPREVFVKRCTAVAGDSVQVESGTSVVPEGMLYVLGDNRDASWDSRNWGFLPIEQVVGRAEFVLWSRGRDGFRWGRIGRGLSRVETPEPRPAG
jgi:signal peptidase I